MTILVLCMLWDLPFLSIIPLWLYAQLIPLPGGLLGCRICLPDPQRGIYWYTLYQFFLGFPIPFALITVAYRRILLKTARYSEALGSQSCTRAQTKRLTHAAIAICTAFSIFWAPFHSLQLAQLTMSYTTLPFYYTYNTAISLGYANSCLNPFIYILLGQNFQRKLGVPVRPAAAGQTSPHGSKSIREDALKSGQPQLHLGSSSGR